MASIATIYSSTTVLSQLYSCVSTPAQCTLSAYPFSLKYFLNPMNVMASLGSILSQKRQLVYISGRLMNIIYSWTLPWRSEPPPMNLFAKSIFRDPQWSQMPPLVSIWSQDRGKGHQISIWAATAVGQTVRLSRTVYLLPFPNYCSRQRNTVRVFRISLPKITEKLQFLGRVLDFCGMVRQKHIKLNKTVSWVFVYYHSKVRPILKIGNGWVLWGSQNSRIAKAIFENSTNRSVSSYLSTAMSSSSLYSEQVVALWMMNLTICLRSNSFLEICMSSSLTLSHSFSSQISLQ